MKSIESPAYQNKSDFMLLIFCADKETLRNLIEKKRKCLNIVFCTLTKFCLGWDECLYQLENGQIGNFIECIYPSQGQFSEDIS